MDFEKSNNKIYTYSGELLLPDEIIRIEEIEDDTFIVHTSGKVLKSVLSIDILEWELPKGDFLRVHPKHLINEHLISKVYLENTNWIELKNGDKIPFSSMLMDNNGYFSKSPSFLKRLIKSIRLYFIKN